MVDRMTEEQFQTGGGRRNMATNHNVWKSWAWRPEKTFSRQVAKQIWIGSLNDSVVSVLISQPLEVSSFREIHMKIFRGDVESGLKLVVTWFRKRLNVCLCVQVWEREREMLKPDESGWRNMGAFLDCTCNSSVSLKLFWYHVLNESCQVLTEL